MSISLMISLRPAVLPAAHFALLQLDTPFSTDRIYRVDASATFALDGEFDADRRWQYAIVAEHKGYQLRSTVLKQIVLLIVLVLLLAGCGEYVAPEATRSPVEQRQTERALAGVTPLPSVAAIGPLPTPDAAATSRAANAAAEVLAVPADDPRALGDPAAPVVFIEFSDYE